MVSFSPDNIGRKEKEKQTNFDARITSDLISFGKKPLMPSSSSPLCIKFDVKS